LLAFNNVSTDSKNRNRMKARADILQIATLVVLVVIVFLLLQISSRQKAMDQEPEGIGQVVGHGAKTDNPLMTERLEGETVNEWLGRHQQAIDATGL
jgi:hypothetical protein